MSNNNNDNQPGPGQIISTPKITKQQRDQYLKSLPIDKYIEDNKEKFIDAQMESMSNERAEREPLPSITSDLFNNEPLIVHTSLGEITIRPMVVYDINIFKMINSPFYKILMGDLSKETSINNDQLFADEEESYELIYQFTHEPKDSYYLFKKGKEYYKDKVMEEVAFKYNPQDAALLVSSIMNHIFKVNLSKIQFAGKDNDDDGNNINAIDGGDKKKLSIPEGVN